MSFVQKSIEKEILKYICNNFLKYNNYWIPFNEVKNDKIFESLSPRELKYWLNILENKKFIRLVEGLNKIQIEVKLEGLIHYEKFYSTDQDYYTSLTIDILNLLRRIEKEEIKLNLGTGNQVGILPFSIVFDLINRSENETASITYIIHEIDKKYSNGVGWTDKKLIFFDEIEPFVTKFGRDFLEYQLKLKNLFQNVFDDYGKEIILEEYKHIKNLISLNKWKDVAIKCGSILEYLLTDHFKKCKKEDENYDLTFIKSYDKQGNPKKGNLLDEKTSFAQKIKFVLENEIFGRKFNSDWKFVYNVIRSYRNYIHITKLVKEKVVFTKEIIEQIYPIFERLITLF